MAINIYSGVMGSGKTYEVISSVVIPALCQGRRVVTNIRGINNDLIRAYCSEKFDIPLEKIGHVVSVSDEEVRDKDFFPTHQTHEMEESRSVVLPGDLVAVDEAYKIWGSDEKIPKEHQVFFREHRHYIHPVTGVTCDLVLMTQDIGDLHRSIRVIAEQTFKCHKAKGVGMNNVYTIAMWEGWKQHAKTMVKDWTQTYKPEIFPLYKSYTGSGEAQGKETAVDSRQNIFGDRKLLMKIGFFIAVALFIMWRLFHWWYVKTHPEEEAKAAASGSVAPGAPAAAAKVASSSASSEWRVSGVVLFDGKRQVVLVSSNAVRVEDAVMFVGDGFRLSGSVDGQKVTRYSGPSITSGVVK
jgi:zona occludens toxin